MCHRTTRRRRRLALLLLLSLPFPSTTVAAASGPAPAVGHESTPPSRSAQSGPSFAPGFSSVDRWHLTAAFDTAVRKLERRDACRSLFDGLALDARTALNGTLYEPARGSLAKVRCRGSVVALTVVNGQRTRLCEPFQRMSMSDQASTLIHEALHRAGLGESPHDPSAPSAREIRDMVGSACGL
jgi:hypothetical protein